ncbi:MAG: hypothetical protein R2727_04700 [Bacteroidales bacterium]
MDEIIKWYEGRHGVKAAALKALSRSQARPAYRKLRGCCFRIWVYMGTYQGYRSIAGICVRQVPRGDVATRNYLSRNVKN